MELIFGNTKDLCGFITAFHAQKTSLNKYVTSPQPDVDYPKFIIKFLKTMKYRNLNQFSPMYVPQQFYQVQPQMQQQMPMMQPGMGFGQQPVFYSMPMGGVMPNPRMAMQTSQMSQGPVFRNGYDIVNRRGEFKKLSKPNRQEILKNILVGKLKLSKIPEL